MNRPTRPDEYRFDARYGRLIRKTGIGTVPFALFHYQGELKLQPQEVWFIAYILAHRWTSELPFPSLARMAAHAGLTKRALRNYKDSLVAKGLLQVVPRFRPDGGVTSHGYDFSPLFDALDVLITRDLEQWTRRSPQMLEEGGDGDDETPGERLSPSLPPGAPAIPPSGEDTFPGPRKRLLSGRGKSRSTAGGDISSPQEEDAEGTRSRSQIPVTKANLATDQGDASMGPAHRRQPDGDRSTGASGAVEPPPSGATRAVRAAGRADVSARKPGAGPLRQLDELMDEISAQLHDAPASFQGNRVRLARLWQDSGLDEAAFRAVAAESVRRTQSASGRIRRRAEPGAAFPGARNKVPYFLAVLENLIAGRESAGAAADSPAAQNAASLNMAENRATAPDAAALWETVGAALRLRLRANEWETWLSDGRALAADGAALTVALPTALAADWAARKWGALANAAAEQALGRPLRVCFVAEDSGAPGW